MLPYCELHIFKICADTYGEVMSDISVKLLCSLSPTLFSLYIDELEICLDKIDGDSLCLGLEGGLFIPRTNKRECKNGYYFRHSIHKEDSVSISLVCASKEVFKILNVKVDVQKGVQWFREIVDNICVSFI